MNGIDRVNYTLDPISYRSVGERRLAESILSHEGKWDEATQCFMTRERLLQDLTRRFASLNVLLRHAPSRAYVVEGRDVDAAYPQCPKILMKQHNVNNSQLSLEDPTKQNIEYRRQIASRNVMMREREMEGNRGTGILDGKERVEWLDSLETTFAGISKGTSSQHTTSNADGMKQMPRQAKELSNQNTAHQTTQQLPRLGDDSKHSSLLVQLKRTKNIYSKHQSDSTIVKSILSMEANAHMKSAITRMFADPRNAENISKEEHERREKEFADERARTSEYQSNLIKEEREAIERELAQLR